MIILGILIGFLINFVYRFIKSRRNNNIVQAMAFDNDLPTGAYPLQIKRVKDGDTLVGTIKLPWNTGLIDVSIRCAGYDAFEITKKRKSVVFTDNEIENGQKATNYLNKLILKSTNCCISPSTQEFDCYGRVFGFVYLKIDNVYVDLAHHMTEHGFDRNTALNYIKGPKYESL